MNKKIELTNVYIVNQNNRARINIPLDFIKSGTLKVNMPYDLVLIEKGFEESLIKRMVKKQNYYEVEFVNGEIINVPIKEK